MREWTESTLANICTTIRAGGTPLVDNPSFYGGDIPFVTIEDITRTGRRVERTRRNLTRAGLAHSAAWLVPEGHILYSMYATLGKVTVNLVPVATNQAILAIAPNPAVMDSRFLHHALEWMQPVAHRFAAQTTQANLSAAIVRNVSVRYPVNVPEQQRIAEILSTVDEAIEQTEALITKTQQIKAGLMHDLFTRGVTPDGQLRPPREQAPELYKQSPLGWIPKEWETILLDAVALRGSGHTPSKSHPQYWNGGIKWISLADSWRLDHVHISDTDYKISEAGIAHSSAVLHPAGIVVLSRDAGVGKSAVTTCAMAVSQHFMCWRCGPRLHNYYLYYWLQQHKWQFEHIATGSTIPTIGLRYFRHYRINMPSEIAEQKAIASALLTAEDKLSRFEEDLQKLGQVRSGLMHDLLTGRVRVPVKAATKSSAAASERDAVLAARDHAEPAHAG